MTPQVNQLMTILARSPFWAILPEHFTSLLTMVSSLKRSDAPMSFDAASLGARPLIGTKDKTKIAIIPIEGILTKDGPSWLGSTYGLITDAAEKVGADPAISRVVLAVDSPGGEVNGLPETATVLSQLAKVKPVSAIVHGIAASAAYWLTSQASDITLTPSGEVGSVGIRMMHADISKALDDMGIRVTELYSGNYKTEWSPFKPVTEDAKADMTRRLVSIHKDFINAVANGRGKRTTEDIRNARYGEGRMFPASDAMGHGLVDRIQAPREFYKAILPAQEHEDSAPAFPIGLKRARLDLERKRF